MDIAHLMKTKADTLFPGLLSSEEMEAIHLRRKKKAKKSGKKLSSKLLDVKEDEYILPGGGFDDQGNAIADFDVRRYMDDLEDPETGTLHDLKIDTRDLPRAKNFYDFAINLSGKRVHHPWSRQMWIGAMLFGEICPVCSNKDWLDVHNVPKDYKAKDMPEHLVFLEHGKCPKCKRNKWELIQKHGLRNYIQLASVLGQRSGKSSSLATYASYLTHMLLKFPNYADMTSSMQASTELTFTFVSLSASKAIGVMWTPYKKLVTEDNKWFKDYLALMDHYKQRYGKELYRISTIYASFYTKNLRFYPSGPMSTTLRGDTRVGGALDELGLFPLPSGDEEEDENSERANADEAHKSLYNSLTTVNLAYNELLSKGYNTAPPPILFNVSSPISLRDKMMRLLKESRTEEGSKYILGVNLPTWEVNPFMTRQTPVIAAAYASNAEKAERDFGANPPAVHSRFIQVKTVESDLFINGQNSHNFIYLYDQPGEIYGRIERIRTFKYPSVISLDAGSVNNSFCVTAGHYNFDTGKTVVTTILECMPHDGRNVNFNLIYQKVILPLAKDLNAIGMVADQWQSLDLLHRIKMDMGKNPKGKTRTESKQYSPRRKDFDMARGMLEQRNAVLPSVDKKDAERAIEGMVENYRQEMLNKPIAHLLLQMLTVRDVGESRCPEKGEGMTDDIFRSLVLLLSTIHNPKVMEKLIEAKDFVYGAQGGAAARPVFLSRGGYRHPGLR